MKIIKIDKIPYNIPQKWEDVTVSKFAELHKLEEPNTLNVVSILTGIDKQIFLDTHETILRKVIAQMPFYKETIIEEKVKEFYLDGVKYIYNGDFDEICLAQYLDVEVRVEEAEGKEVEAIAYVIGVLYREEGKKYNSDKAAKLKEKINNLPITKFYGAISFFLSNLENSKKNKNLYLMVTLLLERIRKQL